MKIFDGRLYLTVGCLAVLLAIASVDGEEIQHGTFGFSEEFYAVAENTLSGWAVITVARVGGSAGAVSVSYYTVDETAVAGSDYTAVSGTLLFAAGQTSKQFVVPILDDALVEGNETLLLVLTNATGGATLAEGVTTSRLLIVNNDFSAGRLSFNSSSYNVDENAVSVAITVTRTGGSTGVISVDYKTMDGTAIAGLDYFSAFGTLTFADGETNKTFGVQPVDNGIADGDRTVELVLTNATGGAVLGDIPNATLTISNDDFPRGVLSFSSSNYREYESNGMARITVIRTEGSFGRVTVQYYTTAGSATADADYRELNGTIVFNAGVTNTAFFVPIIDDALVERNETVRLVLTNATGGATLGSTSAVLTIVDSDGLPRIENVRRRNAEFEFRFLVEAETRYIVEYCHALAGDYWLPLTNFTATASGPCAITDPMTDAPACFYRVRVER